MTPHCTLLRTAVRLCLVSRVLRSTCKHHTWSILVLHNISIVVLLSIYHCRNIRVTNEANPKAYDTPANDWQWTCLHGVLYNVYMYTSTILIWHFLYMHSEVTTYYN